MGLVAGGTVVTLTGAGFDSSASCTFGIVNSTSVTFVTSTQIKCVAPAQAANSVSVEVANNLMEYTDDRVKFRYYRAFCPQGL
jgi:hypothetical protein